MGTSCTNKSLKHKLADALLSVSAVKKKRLSDSSCAGSSESELNDSSPVKIMSEQTDSMNVSQLLALGEGTSFEAMETTRSSDENESDWEEVNDVAPLQEPVIPKEGVNITVEGPLLNFKRKKKGIDIEGEIRRQLNRRQREIQELMHKTHLLCSIARIKNINTILNSETLLSLGLALINNNKNLYPPKWADLEYLERIVIWFRKHFSFDDNGLNDDSCDNLEERLCYEIIERKTNLRQSLVFIFVIFLRSLGLQARLVHSLVTVPLRPSSKKDESGSFRKVITSERHSSTEEQKIEKKIVTKKASFKDDEKISIIKEGNTVKTSNTVKFKAVGSSRATAKGDESKEVSVKKEQKTTEGKQSKAKTSAKEIEHDKKDKIVAKKVTKASNSKGNVANKPAAAGRPTTRNSRSKVVLEEVNDTSDTIIGKSRISESKPTTSKNTKTQSKKDSLPAEGSKNLVDKSGNERPTRGSKKVNPLKPKASKELSSKRKIIPKICINDAESEEEEFSKHFKPLKKDLAREKIGRKINASPKVSTPVAAKTESDDDFSPVSQKLPRKTKIDRRVLSSDDDPSPTKGKKCQNVWIEVFLEAIEKWITVDVVKEKIHCVNLIYTQTTHPVAYIIACNNNSTLKDVTKRYVPHWHSDTRKRRVSEEWWQETMWPYLPHESAREKEEDDDIAKQLEDMPLPTSISEYKCHPLYALKRHLLKYEAIYPSEAPPLGFIRKEPVYARECVVTLRSREIWYKEARVVRLREDPYKIVKSRPKYDKMTGEWRKDLPLQLFGIWQTEDFIPPIAVDGKVPRNEYGNVDLFKACMLPTGTVHLQIPGLIRVAKKLDIDCAPAVIGFEFHSGGSHPVLDGFVVCEEHKETILDAWNKDIDESARRAQEKFDKRVYGNWRRLIRGLLIREKLKIKYAFGENDEDEPSTPSSKKQVAPKKSAKSG